MITLPAPRLGPKYEAFLRAAQEAGRAVATDAADLDALYAAAKVVASVENGGELSTAGIVDVLVMFLRSKDCKLYEEAIKELIKLLAKREVGYEESRRIAGAFKKALSRGKDVGHLKRMYMNRHQTR